MPKARTEILETVARPAGSDAYRIDILAADKPDVEAAEVTFSLSVVVKPQVDGRKVGNPGLKLLQGLALQEIEKEIAEHIKVLNEQLLGHSAS